MYKIQHTFAVHKSERPMKDKRLLTRSEFQIMHYLWSLPGQSGYTGDIVKSFDDPKPAYTTIATFLKILAQKGFVKSRKKNGKIIFTPTISRAEYAHVALTQTKDFYFDGSFMDMMKFYLNIENPTPEQKDELIQIIQNL